MSYSEKDCANHQKPMPQQKAGQQENTGRYDGQHNRIEISPMFEIEPPKYIIQNN